MIDRVSRGRTDLVFDLIENGQPANATDESGVSLLRWCAYYGDVSAIRFLLARGETLDTLGVTALLYAVAGYWVGRYGETTGRDRAHAPLSAGQRYVVIGWPIEQDGRKLHAGTAIADAAGRVLARSLQVWLLPRSGR